MNRKCSARRTSRPARRRTPRSDLVVALRMVALWSLAVCVAFAVVSRHTRAAALGYEIRELKRELKLLQSENQRLRCEVARLASPQRISAIAMGKLGMKPPGTIRVAERVPLLADAAEPAAGTLVGRPSSLRAAIRWIVAALFELRQAQARRR